MAERRRDVPQGTVETNRLLVALVEVAAAVVERRREAAERRAKMIAVDGGKGRRAA